MSCVQESFPFALASYLLFPHTLATSSPTPPFLQVSGLPPGLQPAQALPISGEAQLLLTLLQCLACGLARSFQGCKHLAALGLWLALNGFELDGSLETKTSRSSDCSESQTEVGPKSHLLPWNLLY